MPRASSKRTAKLYLKNNSKCFRQPIFQVVIIILKILDPWEIWTFWYEIYIDSLLFTFLSELWINLNKKNLFEWLLSITKIENNIFQSSDLNTNFANN